jgi:hypothetical protein
MVLDQVSKESVSKQLPVVLAATLGQAQSDVQGRCHVATASSSCIKAQNTYDELICIDGKGSPPSSACLQLLLG